MVVVGVAGPARHTSSASQEPVCTSPGVEMELVTLVRIVPPVPRTVVALPVERPVSQAPASSQRVQARSVAPMVVAEAAVPAHSHTSAPQGCASTRPRAVTVSAMTTRHAIPVLLTVVSAAATDCAKPDSESIVVPASLTVPVPGAVKHVCPALVSSPLALAGNVARMAVAVPVGSATSTSSASLASASMFRGVVTAPAMPTRIV